MGLDQYIERKVLKKEEIFYWRKFGELQNLMSQIWREQNPDDSGDFNCIELVLTTEICDRVINSIKQKNLPDHEGFFFGPSNKDNKEYLKDTIMKFKQIKSELEEYPDQEIVYYSWY